MGGRVRERGGGRRVREGGRKKGKRQSGGGGRRAREKKGDMYREQTKGERDAILAILLKKVCKTLL